MYDWPEVSALWDKFWVTMGRGLNAAGVDAPETLTRTTDPFEIWRDPKLLIGQTCGWPLANLLGEHVVPIACFDHGLNDCPAGTYRSVIIASSDLSNQDRDVRKLIGSDCKVAINGFESQSGFRVFSEFLNRDPKEVFADDRVELTGSHRNSILAVAQKRADIAAIDAVSFELAKSHEPEAVRNVSIIGYSAPKPALPIITAAANAEQTSQMFTAIEHAIAQLDDMAKSRLNIQGLVSVTREQYDIFLSS